jgi:phenylalanyl-tRNA synthetase beta chain
VVGQVVHSERIPETRLSFNRVDDGSGQLLEVVCGAPNVAVGRSTRSPRRHGRPGQGRDDDRAPEDPRLHLGGHALLGDGARLGADHEGILALDTDAAPGTPILDVLAAGDVRFEFDVLANRPDLLSQRGLARELRRSPASRSAAPTSWARRRRCRPSRPAPARPRPAASRCASRTQTGVPRYCAAVIRGVRVGASPDWLVQRLAGVGARSINNVVDATNYALHGLGQPMHAFDLARLGGAASSSGAPAPASASPRSTASSARSRPSRS